MQTRKATMRALLIGMALISSSAVHADDGILARVNALPTTQPTSDAGATAQWNTIAALATPASLSQWNTAVSAAGGAAAASIAGAMDNFWNALGAADFLDMPASPGLNPATWPNACRAMASALAAINDNSCTLVSADNKPLVQDVLTRINDLVKTLPVAKSTATAATPAPVASPSATPAPTAAPAPKQTAAAAGSPTRSATQRQFDQGGVIVKGLKRSASFYVAPKKAK